MSQLGKIFLWAALFGAFAAVGSGGALILKYNDTKLNLHSTELAKESDEKRIAKDKIEYNALTEAKAESDKELAAANASVDAMQAKLNDAIKEMSHATAAEETASAALKTAQDKLDSINKTLLGESPEDIMADKAKALSDLEAAQAEQKILSDELQASETQVADLKDSLKRSSTGTQPPGISGKITFVDHAWNFVILNVGLSNGVVPNGELIVYRGRNFLGNIRITKAEDNDAVAEILPDVKGSIQIGDSVLN